MRRKDFAIFCDILNYVLILVIFLVSFLMFSMKKIVSHFSYILWVLIMFSGVLMTGCTDGTLDQEDVTEQENGNKPSEDNQDKPSEGEKDDPSEEDGIITFVENDAWTVEFNSPGIVDGYEYDYVVSVTSTDHNYYFISLIKEDYYLETEFDVLAQELYQFFLETYDRYSEIYDYETILQLCYNESAAQFYAISPGSEFRAVVLGVTNEGTLSGLYAVSDIIIPEEIDSSEEGGDDSITFVKNDAWTVEYKPKAEIDGYEKSDVICVTSTDDNYYLISVIEEEFYLETDFEDLAEYIYDDALMMVEIYQEVYGPDYSIFDRCYNTSTAESYLLFDGEYRSVVLGITDEGTLSGLYALSEPFKVQYSEPDSRMK